jgi:mannitol-specific phosphotransferase system IIBC component
LVVSASISFAIGRTIMHFRKKKKAEALQKIEQKAAQALRDAPPGAESKNKSKRKRLARLNR